MKKGLIITLPRHADVTEYLSQFSKEIIEEANISDVPCKKLEDYDANRKNFEKVLEKTNYTKISFLVLVIMSLVTLFVLTIFSALLSVFSSFLNSLLNSERGWPLHLSSNSL